MADRTILVHACYGCDTAWAIDYEPPKCVCMTEEEADLCELIPVEADSFEEAVASVKAPRRDEIVDHPKGGG